MMRYGGRQVRLNKLGIKPTTLITISALALALTPAQAAPLRLASLQVTGAGPLTPSFAPQVFHYAVRCKARQTLSVSARAERDAARLWFNGQPVADALVAAPVTLAGNEDLIIELEAPAGGDRVVYVVHCVPPKFPNVEILRKEPGTAPGLLLVSPYHTPSGANQKFESWIAMLDDNGVPRFQRRVLPPAHNFRWHAHARRFSYNEARPNGFGPVVLLDEELEEVGRVHTVAGLAPAKMHEFLITAEGNYLFIVNNPVVRDLSRYPARKDGPTPSAAQQTHDAVIQEVAPDGKEVFRWNAWDHLKLSDCIDWWFFPKGYAKLNGLDLDAEGNLLTSFRGCSLALKVERPSGRVLWQLGGSDPAEPDPYDERRPTFERPWYRITGDPHGGFCAQHTVTEVAPGHILMFDNRQCVGADQPSSRVVEYRLGADGKAIFAGHHEPGWLTAYGGAVAALANGNRLIAWGGGTSVASISEVDASGSELFALRLFRGENLSLMTYRVFRYTGPPPPLRPMQAHPEAGVAPAVSPATRP